MAAMLRISRLADYGTIIMGALATEQELLSATQLAEKTKVSQPTTMKLLKQLSEAELVKSVRGANGGYQLVAAPEQISVAAIIAAIDGQPALTECGSANSSCAHEAYCGLKGNWQKINQKVNQVLEEYSLADMLQ